MKFIRPLEITDAILTSNVVEDDGPTYSAMATYALGAIVISSHLKYESLIASNTGNPLSDASKWLALGATNRWAMFDQSGGTLTTKTTPIDVTIAAPGRVDGIALLNLDAEEVHIVMTSDDYGVQYDETFDLLSDSGIQSWYAYFSEEVVYATDLVLTGLPLTSNVDIQVVISSAAGTVSVGTLVIGQTRDLGVTVYGVKGGILDYSRKSTDDFGVTTLVERPYAKRSTFRVIAEAGSSDSVYSILAQYRATPVVWVGTEDFAMTWIYGWARSWDVGLEFVSHSTLNIEIEGLT
jgi:hypothetical protein